MLYTSRKLFARKQIVVEHRRVLVASVICCKTRRWASSKENEINYHRALEWMRKQFVQINTKCKLERTWKLIVLNFLLPLIIMACDHKIFVQWILNDLKIYLETSKFSFKQTNKQNNMKFIGNLFVYLVDIYHREEIHFSRVESWKVFFPLKKMANQLANWIFF